VLARFVLTRCRMKTIRIVLFTLCLLGAFAVAGSAATSIAANLHVGPSGRATVDIGFFYDDLASYGTWVERPSYGWVWRPRAVASSWRPYQSGHWVWTDDGWTWISDEPYGWATYHYGRWYLDPDYGWEWVPGDEWGPAWVSWQEGGDYIGWAPLPPSVGWNGGGLGSVDFSAVLSPETYVFVPEREFLAPRLVTYVVPRERVVTVYRQTRNVTNYRVVDNRVFNQGLAVERVQQVTGRPVPRYQVADLGEGQRHQGGRVQANRVAFFRPQVQKAARVAPPPERPAARRAVVSAATPGGPKADRVPPGQARKERTARQAPAPAPTPTAAPTSAPEGRPRGNNGRRQRVEPPAPQPRAEAQNRQRPEKPAPPPAAEPRRQRPARPPQAQGAPADRPHGQGPGQNQGQGQGQAAGKPHGNPHGNPKDRQKPPGQPAQPPPAADR